MIDDYDIYEKTDYKSLTIERYYFGEEKNSFLYEYEKFNKNTFNPFTDLIYKKVIYQDKNTKIFNYEKDFPLSNEIFVKKIPEIFRQQAIDLLKANSKFKNFDNNKVQTLSNDMDKAINEGKYVLYRVYLNNDETKPLYKILLNIARSEWTLDINPKTEKIEALDVDILRI